MIAGKRLLLNKDGFIVLGRVSLLLIVSFNKKKQVYEMFSEYSQVFCGTVLKIGNNHDGW